VAEEDEVALAVDARARAAAAQAAAAAPHAPAASEPPGVASAPPHAPKRPSRAAEFSHQGGAVGERYLWSQSASEVTLSALAPPGTRAKDVRVTLSPPPPGGGTQRLTVALAGAPPLVDAPLAHAVDAPSGEEEVDWELTDFDAAAPAAASDVASSAGVRRAVRVTLRKAPPASNVVHWWRCALEGDPVIDTASIGERAGSAARTAAARAVWAEAEAEFKRRVRERVPVEVDVDDEGEH
jgi:hypothetical protein